MSTAVETAPYLRLTVDQGSDKRPNAALMVRWELSDDALQEIISKDVRDPHIMLVVVNDNHEVEGTRVVRPLGDAMARLEIPKAGESAIYGMIVYRRSDTKKTARYFMNFGERDFLHRVPEGERALTLQIDEYTRQIDAMPRDWERLRIAREGLYAQRDSLSSRSLEVYIEFDEDYRMGTIGAPSSCKVDIPAGAVSKKHPIVDGYCQILPWWWKARVRNNCERRNRLFWTTVSSPVWLPMAIVFGALAGVLVSAFWLGSRLLKVLLALVLLWIGVRDVNYKALGKVRSFGIWDLLDENQEDLSSHWVTKRIPDETAASGYRFVPRALFWRIVNPITVVIGAFAVKAMLSFTGYGLLTVVPLLALIGVAWWLSGVFGEMKSTKGDSNVLEQFDQEIALNKSVLVHDLSSLVYDPSNAPAAAKFSALPKEKRTFHQWLLSLMQVVCKPIER